MGTMLTKNQEKQLLKVTQKNTGRCSAKITRPFMLGLCGYVAPDEFLPLLRSHPMAKKHPELLP